MRGPAAASAAGARARSVRAAVRIGVADLVKKNSERNPWDMCVSATGTKVVLGDTNAHEPFEVGSDALRALPDHSPASARYSQITLAAGPGRYKVIGSQRSARIRPRSAAYAVTHSHDPVRRGRRAVLESTGRFARRGTKMIE